jgi:hypothetical protein
MKRIQLIERDPFKGKIIKNESFTPGRLMAIVKEKNRPFFGHPFLGRVRQRALNVVFHTFLQLIDMDQKGKHTMNL